VTSIGPSAGAPELTIVLATLNERQNLPPLVERLQALPLPPFEVVVVDDGSSDGTREFLTALALKDPRFRLIFHEGKQTTLRAQAVGIERATGPFLAVMDADLQHPPELLPQMCDRLRAGDALVVASRYAPGGSVGYRTPYRAIISRGAEWIAKLVLPETRDLSDPVSGYFAFRREIYRTIDGRYRGYKLLLFVAVMAGNAPRSVVAYRFEPRSTGASKVTQGFSFLRLFLVEVLLAGRLRRQLRTASPAA
jgi:dolichol-phosphate mannosyltransferase